MRISHINSHETGRFLVRPKRAISDSRTIVNNIRKKKLTVNISKQNYKIFEVNIIIVSN